MSSATFDSPWDAMRFALAQVEALNEKRDAMERAGETPTNESFRELFDALQLGIEVLAQLLEAEVDDALRYEFVREQEWYLDAAGRALGLKAAPFCGAMETFFDPDEVEDALDAAMQDEGG